MEWQSEKMVGSSSFVWFSLVLGFFGSLSLKFGFEFDRGAGNDWLGGVGCNHLGS